MAVEKKNIFLKDVTETRPYKYAGGSGGDSVSLPARNIASHASHLKKQFMAAFTNSKKLTPPQVAAIRCKEGTYLEFSGQSGYALTVQSLEHVGKGVRLLNVKHDEDTDIFSATVFVPNHQEPYFLKKLEKYASQEKEKKLFDSIEDVEEALWQDLWTDDKKKLPDIIEIWCEMWLRVDENASGDDDLEPWQVVQENFESLCDALDIAYSRRSVHFPERLVVVVRANAAGLQQLVNEAGNVAEIRQAPELTGFFIDELGYSEQKQWIVELISRTEYRFTNTAVCIFDTGLNSEHPLLKEACTNHTHTVNSSWGEHDHDGHGTQMAGIALYYNLKEQFLTPETVTLVHTVESVKILPPKGRNPDYAYGGITEYAAYEVESSDAGTSRIFCMAVTAEQSEKGHPTVWSATLDKLAAGVDDPRVKRLFFVSAGNVHPLDLQTAPYPSAETLHTVEDPGQSWNAVTVGAYNSEIMPGLTWGEYQPVADNGELSPYSATSLLWDNEWPIKPEILCDGGNVAQRGDLYTSHDDFSLLTTGHEHLTKPLATIHGTSSATAQAAWMAAQIQAEYPNIWPETIRALLVHSAQWTKKMKKQFNVQEKKADRRTLLRACGYGIPDVGRAIQCMQNSVNLIVEAELQPYKKGEGSRYETNEMHFHTIPWPRSVLERLENELIEMRVTLSYFIEPGPGEVGWNNKYTYPSCQLRFDVRNKDETEEDFKKRINKAMRGEDKSDSGEGTSGSDFWYLGKSRNVGSVHSDFRIQNAIDLCDSNMIGIFPANGWWRKRSHLKRYNKKIRYSLVVSLSTPKASIDLYTPIIAQIKIPVETEVPNRHKSPDS